MTVRLAVQNPRDSGWAGKMTWNGLPMVCENCDKGMLTSDIAFDGDSAGL